MKRIRFYVLPDPVNLLPNNFSLSCGLDVTTFAYDQDYDLGPHKISFHRGLKPTLAISSDIYDILISSPAHNPNGNVQTMVLTAGQYHSIHINSQNILDLINCIARVIIDTGVLDAESIQILINSNCLLLNYDPMNVNVASYDLRLGDRIWCNGQYHDLDSSNDVFEIPPYSYALVTSLEVANMPKYLVARYDVKVSLFFRGVILSNGPQVDPGYIGDLFCVLYNGSDTEIALKRKIHFATIEFATTIRPTAGYSGKYQGQQGFTPFIPDEVRHSKGGVLAEKMTALSNDLNAKQEQFIAAATAREANTDRRINWMSIITTVALTAGGIFIAVAQSTNSSAQAQISELKTLIGDLKASIKATEPSNSKPSTKPSVKSTEIQKK
ncbi:hypothetical protein ACFFLM_11220 [Deinococcus oregonensis]|uniref:dUTPase-like domain-containing protein n=1 Tax=Deinococcus oregonensis TaxID=1805970 RepID=A0ABV6AYF1_9DEIO